MVHSGLVQETRLLYQYLHSPSELCWEDFSTAKTRDDEKSSDTSASVVKSLPSSSKGGVAEAIGFKEFLPYLEAEAEAAATTRAREITTITNVIHDESLLDVDLASLMSQCISDIQHATVQYAKRQATWLRNRLLPQSTERGATLFHYCPTPSSTPAETHCNKGSGSGGGKVSSGEHSCASLSSLVVAISCHLEQKATSSIVSKCLSHNSNDLGLGDRMTLKRKIFRCDTCDDQCFQGKEQFNIHTKSKKHKKRVASKRKREHREATQSANT